MRQILLLFLLGYSGFFYCLKEQEEVISFSAELKDADFVEFVSLVEDQAGLTFYFKESWVQHRRMKATDETI